MIIQLLSDIHIEFYRVPELKKAYLDSLIREADVLVLAGDIHVGRTNVLEVIQHFAPHYKYVIFTPGNHEYYNGISYGDFRRPSFQDKLPKNAFLLDRDTMILDNVVFIGATLWSDVLVFPILEKLVRRYIPDFRRMQGNSPQEHTKRFYQDKEYILDQAYKFDEQDKVIITHFLPHFSCVHPQFLTNPGSDEYLLNYYFANNISEIQEIRKAIWLCGHTHTDVAVKVGNTSIYARPSGYPGERETIEPLRLEIEK